MRARFFPFGVVSKPCRRLSVHRLMLACLVALLSFAPGSITFAESEVNTSAKADRVPDKPTIQRIAVIGDSLAQDLWNGLHKLYRDNDKVEIIRFTQVSTGLVRDDVYNWKDALTEFVSAQEFDIAIVLMGGNDRQPIRANGKRLKRHTDAWYEEYGNRVAALIDILKPEATQVYWLGLPIVRSNRMARDYRRFNKIYKAQADALDIKFIDTWSLFEDENGSYTSFGPDVSGVNRTLRKDDGTHFTVTGKHRFAQDIMEIIDQDMSAKIPGLRLNSASEPSKG